MLKILNIFRLWLKIWLYFIHPRSGEHKIWNMQFLPVWTLITRFLWSCIIERFFYIENSFPQMQFKSIQGKERLLMVLCINYKTTLSKGQLISKGLFTILNSFKKETKKFDFTIYHDTSGWIVLFYFFGRIKDIKKIFRNYLIIMYVYHKKLKAGCSLPGMYYVCR